MCWWRNWVTEFQSVKIDGGLNAANRPLKYCLFRRWGSDLLREFSKKCWEARVTFGVYLLVSLLIYGVSLIFKVWSNKIPPWSVEKQVHIWCWYLIHDKTILLPIPVSRSNTSKSHSRYARKYQIEIHYTSYKFAPPIRSIKSPSSTQSPSQPMATRRIL